MNGQLRVGRRAIRGIAQHTVVGSKGYAVQRNVGRKIVVPL